MKRILFPFIFLLVYVGATAQTLSTQIQAKRGVFTEKVYLRDKWVDKVSTDLNSSDTVNNNAIVTAKAVADFLKVNYGGACNIVLAGADPTGVNNASGVVQSLINSGCKVVYMPTGKYRFDNTVQMRDNVTVVGDGRGTIIKLSKNQPAFKCGWALGGSKTTFKDISFEGTYFDSTAQDGIFADSSNGILASNVTATKLAGAAIRMRKTGFCCAMYTMNAVRGNIIDNCYFDSCGIGVKIDTVAEFITVANTTCTNGGIGIFTAAGSSNISSCRLGMNNYGLYVTGGSNNAHGTCENTHLPHNKQYGVYVTGATNGYRFNGNMIRQNPTADVYVENSNNVMFEHNDIGAVAVTVINSTGTKFIDNLYWGPPVWNITGTAPTIIQNGETLNTVSIKDVVNNKAFNIAHSNGLADISGATRLRMANDTLNFYTPGTSHVYAGSETANDSLIITSNTTSAKSLISFGTSSTGMVYNEANGRLGIGTRNPSTQLHIESSGIAQANIYTTSNSGHGRIVMNNMADVTTGFQILFGGNSSSFVPGGAVISSIKNFLAITCEQGDIRFTKSPFINGSNEHARFLNNGNFLINSTSDNSIGKLQVNGKVTISMADSTNTAPNTLYVQPGTGELKKAPYLSFIKGTVTYTFGSVAASSSAITTVSVPGATLGDPVTITKASGAYTNGEVFDAFVSSPGTVTIRVNNVSGGSANYVSDTYNFILFKY